jgi:hypothetical protein
VLRLRAGGKNSGSSGANAATTPKLSRSEHQEGTSTTAHHRVDDTSISTMAVRHVVACVVAPLCNPPIADALSCIMSCPHPQSFDHEADDSDTTQPYGLDEEQAAGNAHAHCVQLCPAAVLAAVAAGSNTEAQRLIPAWLLEQSAGRDDRCSAPHRTMALGHQGPRTAQSQITEDMPKHGSSRGENLVNCT